MIKLVELRKISYNILKRRSTAGDFLLPTVLRNPNILRAKGLGISKTTDGNSRLVGCRYLGSAEPFCFWN